MAPLLFDFQNVTVCRDGIPVLRDLSLEVRLGQHIAILGPNGSGKSTLMKTITREVYPQQNDGSRFEVFGQARWDVFELRRRLGIVSPDLLSRLTRPVTARELVLSGFFSGLGLWPHQVVTPAMERKMRAVLKFLEISHLADRPLDAMSSGENRRALIGRALVHDPEALILDEPTNGLDPKAIREFRTLMRKIARAGVSLVLVTHHLHDIIPDIGRVVFLKKGAILADGPKRTTLTARGLSRLFDTPVRVVTRAGCYDLI